MKTALPSKVYLTFVLAIIVIALLGYFYISSTTGLITSCKKIEENQEKINGTNHFLYLLRHLESNTRGYVICGNEIFIGDYNNSKKSILDQLQLVKKIVAPEERVGLNEIERLTALKLEFTEELLRLLKEGKKDEAEKLIGEGKGRLLTIDIEGRAGKIIEKIKRNSVHLDSQFNDKSQRIFAIILLGKVITLALFFVGIVKILFELKKRLHLERELQDKNVRLSELNNTLEEKNEQLRIANEKITETTENKIRKQDSLFRTVLNNIPSPIFLFNTDYEAIFRNEASLNKSTELYLIADRDTSSESTRRLYPHFFEGLDAAMGRNNILEEELTFFKQNGERRIYLARFVPILENAVVESILVINHDITERKKYEEELLELNAFLDNKVKERTEELEKINEKLNKTTEELLDLYNNAPLGYYSLDSDGKIIKINKTSLKLLGYKEEDLLGKSFRETLLPENLHGIFENSFPLLKQGRPVENAEPNFIKKDGSLLPVLLNVSAVRDHQGNFISTRSAFTDNTEIKKARTEVEKYVEALQIANKELEAFSYTISHDLRAPLRSINGFSQILKKEYGDVLDDEGKRFIDIILTNSSQMGAMIDELLEFARLGKKGMTKTEFSMETVVREVIEQAMNFNKELINQVFSIAPLPVVIADKNLIKQVWQNLILNALKFSSQRSAQKIWIFWEEDLNFFTFRIVDNGVGFDPRYSSKLFGVFQRLHSMEEFEGTGAGLAIVQRIIQSHGGKVWAESELNKGATFYFSLPKN
jgi:PAS domain S-box-containing protein